MIQWVNTLLGLMPTASIARVAAPPSIKRSFRLNDLVGIKNCQHSLEKATTIVKIKEDNRMVVRSALFFLVLRIR